MKELSDELSEKPSTAISVNPVAAELGLQNESRKIH